MNYYFYFFCKQSTSCLCIHICCIAISVKNMVLCYFDSIIYKHIESLCLFCHESFCQRNSNVLTLHYLFINFFYSYVYYYLFIYFRNIRPYLCLHNNDFLLLYLACNLISNIRILVSHSICTNGLF